MKQSFDLSESGKTARVARMSAAIVGFSALMWFLLRVIPKPSRATYPCQRAAFPVASAFVIWLCASMAGLFSLSGLRTLVRRYRWAAVSLCVLTVAVGSIWLAHFRAIAAAEIATRYNFQPKERNVPLGIARGVYPGRVVWAHDPKAAHWTGHIESTTDQWWMEGSTDQPRVDAMLSSTLRKLTGSATDDAAWKTIFTYYNSNSRGLKKTSYQPGEIVAVKVNLNNSSAKGPDNIVNVSPQVALAVIRQLVNHAHVPAANIVVYDARRNIYPGLLTKIWSEFKDVRFVQADPPDPAQPKNPGYGDYQGLEAAQWVEGVSYSANNNVYKDAKMIPKQIMDATYIVNLALLKAHSYPYSANEGGDEGQTGVTMTGKNHFGSIKGTWELHDAINTNQHGTPHAYSPIVDLSASPNLGAKTILYLLDGLYCARRHQSYPLHFPNAPFNNQVEPYANPQWPSSILASLDGVALDSVGLDILLSQTKNNLDANNHPRIAIRENADDYLQEEALADHPPSGTAYIQNGKPVTSLGVTEHWDNDASRQYTRNKDPKNGKGIDLVYLPM
ncbi:MAG: DUF362 domain-containing protein [Terracidiphilus sp.]|jgi:uncharacterized protein (DUF362 family)